MIELTEHQRMTLILIGFGVRRYFDGCFYSEEDPNEKLDLRSANALYRRGLIDWYTTGSNPHFTVLILTGAGEQIFEEIR